MIAKLIRNRNVYKYQAHEHTPESVAIQTNLVGPPYYRTIWLPTSDHLSRTNQRQEIENEIKSLVRHGHCLSVQLLSTSSLLVG